MVAQHPTAQPALTTVPHLTNSFFNFLQISVVLCAGYVSCAQLQGVVGSSHARAAAAWAGRDRDTPHRVVMRGPGRIFAGQNEVSAVTDLLPLIGPCLRCAAVPLHPPPCETYKNASHSRL